MGKEDVKIFVAHMPDIFGYGILVVHTDKKKAKNILKKKFFEWRNENNKYPHSNPVLSYSFDRAMEYFSGYVEEIEIGKVYYDDFKY